MLESDSNSRIDLGFYFASINLFSAFKKGNSYFLSHMSEDDYLTMLVHTSSNSIGNEVVPYTISDPNAVFSHIQMLLGMKYSDSDKENLGKYVAGPLDKEKPIKDASGRPMDVENLGYAFNIETPNGRVSLPVNCCAEWIFREVRKLIYCADGIKLHKSLVICIPQAYLSVQRNALEEAAQLAGFPNVKLVNDTDAAFTWHKKYLRSSENNQNMVNQQESIMNEKNKQYDKAFCICCDHSFAGWSYYTWSEEGEWKPKSRGCFEKLSLINYIEEVTDKKTDELWKKISAEEKIGRKMSEISPAVFFKICRLISNYVELHENNTLCIRFGNKKQNAVSINITQKEITDLLEAFGNELREKLAQLIDMEHFSGLEDTALICVGECFSVNKVKNSIRELFKHPENTEQPYGMKVMSSNELAVSACDCNEEDNSFLFSSITGSNPPKKIQSTTIYEIGFLFKSIFGDGTSFQSLVKSGVTLPYRATSKRYSFSSNKQEAILTFYERDNSDSYEKYRPFKKYMIYRDEKHPCVPEPPKPPRDEDEDDEDEYDEEYDYRYRDTPEKEQKREDPKKNHFIINYELSEDMKLTILSIIWCIDNQPMKFKDLDESEEEKKRKSEERKIMSSFFSYDGLH